MKLLDRYLIRELLVPFVTGLIAIVGMFQINAYMFVAKTFNLQHVSATAVLQYILYLTPSFLKMTLPVAVALGTSLAISRLARESEIVAIRACGTRVLRVIAPYCFVGVLVGLANFAIIDRVSPHSTKRANALLFQIGLAGGVSNIASNTMIRLAQYTASFGTIYRQGEDMDVHDILLVDRPQPGVTELITADVARYSKGNWSFKNAYYRRLDGLDLIVAKPLSNFIVNQKIIPDDIFNPPSGEDDSIQGLRESIRTGKKANLDVKRLEVEYYGDFAIPAACLIFALVSPVFSIFFAKSGGFVGILLSIVMVMVYYNAFVVSTDILGKVDSIPAWLAAWLPNVLFTMLGLVGIRKLE